MSASHNELARELEEVEDERDALLSILAGIEAINQETIPAEIVWRLSDGEAPVKVWREHRGLTSEELATAAHLDVDVVERIERNEQPADFVTIAEIARALRLDMEMLLPVPDEGRTPR
jgi:ribosome-binding protein aMBF1 (putative translation factor)